MQPCHYVYADKILPLGFANFASDGKSSLVDEHSFVA